VTRSADVVVVGSVNRDYVCRVDSLPAPGETVLGGEVSVGAGGKGGNQAVAASLLGARTALIARVGRDADGQALVDGLVSAGVDVDDVAAIETRTGLAFVLVDAYGENSIVVAPGANERLEPDAVAAAVRRLLTPRGGVLVTQAEIPAETSAAAIEAAVEVGRLVVVNLAPYRPIDEALLARCDPLVVNEAEAGGLLAREVRGADQARAAAAELAGRAQSAVVTVGPEGAAVARGDWVEQVPVEPVDAVDTTGAGDAFTGALAAALSADFDLLEAVRVGVRAGAYSVARAGAQASFSTAADLGFRRPSTDR
jgi:ribokinase